MKKHLLKSCLFTVLLILNHNLFGQISIKPAYVGFGYNLSHARLKWINEFVDDYNKTPVKSGGWQMTDSMKHIHWLDGGYFTSALRFNEVYLELNWTRRFGSTFANYETPSKTERWIGYKTSCLGLGLYAPFSYNEQTAVLLGIDLDFMRGRLLTQLTHRDADWVELNSFRNLGLQPSLQFHYKFFPNIPLKLGFKLYYQAFLKRNNVSQLDAEMVNNFTDSSDKLKVAGGNWGFTVFGAIDLENFKLPKPKPKEKIPEIEVPPIITVSGKITDEKTGKLMGASLVITNKFNSTEKYTISSTSGLYKIDLKNNNAYIFKLEAMGYEPLSETVELSNILIKDYNKDFVMKKLNIGKAITLNNIYFEKGSAVLLPESFPELETLLKFLKENETVEIEIAGHTSSEGGLDYNMKLSQDRANSIQNWLVNKGISVSRITAKGYGPTVPVASNDTEEGRKLNRRVEFKILKY